MVPNIKKGEWRREMSFTKKIFERYPVDFLLVVKRPFEMNSLAYFIGRDGLSYLDLQLKLFSFNVPKEEIKVLDKKEGEDIIIENRVSLRKFLNEKN